MSEEQRLNRVGDILKFSRLKHPQDIVRYLSNISVEAISLLLDVLEVIELPENRVLLCDVLVPFSRDFPDSFVEKLRTTDKPQMQRDMVYVLDRSNHPDKLKFFTSALKSKNLALRLEVMSIIARGRTGEARKMIASMLNDDNMQIRLQAARVLPEFDRERGFTDLMNLVKDKAFEERKPEEKEAIYAAIGATGLAGAISYFQQLVQQKAGLFNKQKSIADKQLAIAGLGGACTIQAAKLLQELTEDKNQPPEVTTSAKIHLARVRKQLFGNAEKEG
jgi:hypothetical protein